MEVSIPLSTLQSNSYNRCKIPKVPFVLRDANSKSSDDYEPKVVSIGPYHNGKSHLKFVEDFKPQALQMFIDDETSKFNETFFIEKILDKIEDVRGCYVDEYSDIRNEDLARMMLLDACFIINEIKICTEGSSKARGKKLETLKYLGTSIYLMVKRDLYLLENQVPYWILKLLVSLRYGDEQGKDFITKVDKYCNDMLFDKGSSSIRELPISDHLLEAFRGVLVRGKYQVGKERHEESSSWYVFRSVSELKSKGIHFRPSKVNSLKEGVNFSSSTGSAVLTLPRWYVSIHTRVFFVNMIAYEFHPHSCQDDHKIVSAYVNFMRSLLNSPADAKELREKGILLNNLGSDGEVVEVYKCLNTYGGEDVYLYKDVKGKITEHCESKAKTWLAEFKSTYFSSPWSAIAFLAAVVAFVLTFLQTYYAVKDGTKPSKGKGSGSGSGSQSRF